MADKKRRNTPNTGNKRNNGRRKKKGRLKGLIAAELIVVVVLVMIVGHNLGLGTGITNFVNSIRKLQSRNWISQGSTALMRCS